MWQSACLSCSVSGDNPSVSVLEGTVPSPAPCCPFANGYLLPLVPQPCSPDMPTLAHL